MYYRGEYFLQRELFILLSGKSVLNRKYIKRGIRMGIILMLHYSSVKCKEISVVLHDFHCVFRSLSWWGLKIVSA